MKCRRCRAPAVIDVRRHNAAFCRDCFVHHCREQVRRAIDDFDMIQPGERVLVAVSGGKDSLGLWHLLRALDIDADGLYIGLGIGEYSDESGEYVLKFVKEHDWPLIEIDLPRIAELQHGCRCKRFRQRTDIEARLGCHPYAVFLVRQAVALPREKCAGAFRQDYSTEVVCARVRLDDGGCL